MSKQNHITSALALAGALALTACGGSDVVLNPVPAPITPAPATPAKPVESTITVDFNKGIEGWSADVADFHDDTRAADVVADWRNLPAGFTGKGYYLASTNRSDDVFQFVKHQVGGFVPGARYALSFEMRYLTDAGTGCFGVGGSRGDSLYMVVAASAEEPKVVKDADTYSHLNLDRGNQSQSGRQGKVLGAQGEDGLLCEGGKWGAAVRKSSEPIELQADQDGKFWIVLGTDSGYEADNAFYLQGATVNVKPL